MSNRKTEIRNEIELVSAVKSCRQCKWFWGADAPYGPFASHDWAEQYPVEILNGPNAVGDSKTVWAEVIERGQDYVEPAILRGCRKAPIMTIGINPNMTAYFAGSKATTWTYPSFRDESTYAYYYRHATVYQESFSLESLRELVEAGTEIVAPINGYLLVDRSSSHRWMDFRYYETPDDTQAPVARDEAAWKSGDRFVVFADKNYKKTRWLEVSKGDLVAAKVRQRLKASAELYAEDTGYYQRILPVIDGFNKLLVESGHEKLQLSVGEDVSMHDMVACASPGWSDKLDIPRDYIADKCVNINRYAIDQLVQSRPRLIIVVSTSSLEMFDEGITRAGGRIDMNYRDRDVYDVLKEYSHHPAMLTLPLPSGGQMQSRVLLVPHFSYWQNYIPQTRFSLQSWQVFNTQYPQDAKKLLDAKRYRAREGEPFISIDIKNTEDEQMQLGISNNAWQLLMDYHYDPYQLMLDTLVQEHELQPWVSDPTATHMDRAQGDCHFCDNNGRWSFPEGCPYGLAK